MVALSTAEAKYYALGMAGQEAVRVEQLCQEFYLNFRKSIHIYSDIFWHYIQELIQQKIIHTSHIPGMENDTDFFAKAFSHIEHKCCLKLLGME